MYSIKIYDSNGTVIGELPAASAQDVIKYINKGFIVKDIKTGKPISIEEASSCIGVSDGFINN